VETVTLWGIFDEYNVHLKWNLLKRPILINVYFYIPVLSLDVFVCCNISEQPDRIQCLVSVETSSSVFLTQDKGLPAGQWPHE